MFEKILRQPFLVLLSSLTVINIALIMKVIISRNKINTFRVANTYSNNLDTSLSLDTRHKNGQNPNQINNEEKHVIYNSEIKKIDHFRSINIDDNQILGCNHCLEFYKVGTAICPNCGRLLNINPSV